MLRTRNRLILKHAPILLGAALCMAPAFISGCKRSGTPDWQQQDTPPPVSIATPPADKAIPQPGEEFRFIAYNVKNWLTEDEGKRKLSPTPKPEKEKAAVISIISRNRPDVLGICEIGTREDLADLQNRLKQAGVDLPYSIHIGGADPVRHLALLSRFPIISTSSSAETDYQLEGRAMTMNRGILDATVQAGDKIYRFIGVHLKSRIEEQEMDQEAIRLHEAKLVRSHVNGILATRPESRLVVYGDFNDTRSTNTLKTLTGDNSAANYLMMLPAKDSRGETWTHYWNQTDTYSRIDFITVSRALKPYINLKASHIIEDSGWNDASDHRAVLAVFD